MNHDGSALDTAVVQLLQADAALSALMPDGVYIDEAPAGSRAFVIVSVTSALDEHTLDGAGFELVTYAVLAVASAPGTPGDTVRAAADRIDQILHGATPVVPPFPAVKLTRTERLRPPVAPDSNDHSIRWLSRGGTYELFASK